MQPTSARPHPWRMLLIGMSAQGAQAMFVNGVAFLLPALTRDDGAHLGRLGLLVSMPVLGVLVSLLAWGAAADRWGERIVLVLGMGLSTVAGILAGTGAGSLPVLGLAFFLGGLGGSSANAASGRVVVGWFPAAQRGLAMGIRQMSLPLGIAIAAATMPVLALDHGVGLAMAVPTIACGLATVATALWLVDPPRPERAEAERTGALENPYRRSHFLLRIHAASALLVVPQYVVWTFALTWLVDRRGWEGAAAGALISVIQLSGAFARIGAGELSDLVGSRMAPMRWIAVAGFITMGLLALTDRLDSPWAIAALVAASLATVSPNGLAFTAVAEYAGPFYSGRALGVQNSGQFAVSALVPTLAGWTIQAWGYPATFAWTAVLPALAVAVIPRDRPARPGRPATMSH